MPKIKTVYTCHKCDAQSPKWTGRCLECGTWGMMKEESRKQNPPLAEESRITTTAAPGKTMHLGEIQASSFKLQATGIREFDRVLGGGITPGSITLLAGEPGIGKSTLVVHIARTFTTTKPILYVAGEESPSQLKERFDRLGVINENIRILSDTTAEVIVATIDALKPELVIVDSVQTLTAEATSGTGAPTQLRASTALLAHYAKKSNIPLLLIGQVTKSLDIAGPKLLEHLVDTVLTFEGEPTAGIRILRAHKNRFGSTDEVGIFQMTDSGLTEVSNPSATFLATRSKAPGSIVTCVLEGRRPILLEIQALATATRFATPVRRASGFDATRLSLLIATLEKHCPTLGVGQLDIHLNVTGGFRIREPAADLAVLLALAASAKNQHIPSTTMAIGEVGLGGELRAVSHADRRIAEASKLGFTECCVPSVEKTKTPQAYTQPFSHITEALAFLNLS